MTHRIEAHAIHWDFMWGLVGLLVSVFLMVILGGATRLTGSGLSMTQWQPFNILPPLTAQDWIQAFDLYKKTPEFLCVNVHFSLNDFKSIFWLEYLHRLWGRLIGCFVLYPTYLVWLRPSLRGFYTKKIFFLWAVGFCQGIMGWYMVKSGLVNDPCVSPLRLSFHLLLAGALVVCVAWMILCARCGQLSFWRALVATKFLFVSLGLTLFYGGLVAGHKAGLIYNTFPLMEGCFLPDDGGRHLLFDPSMVQWMHRILATITVGFFLFCGIRYAKSKSRLTQKAAVGLIFLTLLQYLLGVLTLLHVVPLWYGLGHQAVAFLLLSCIVLVTYSLERDRA